MGAQGGLIPHPSVGASCPLAGSDRAQRERPSEKHINAFRPGASSAFSIMLGLLETLRNVALISGQEPASFLIAVFEDGRLVLTAPDACGFDLRQLRN